MDINLESKYLEELGKGDHKAFDMLYIQYSPRLKHFLTGFIKNRDEASDMTQDIFYKIWTNRETISKVDSFKAYLFRMARNMIYDYYEHSLIEENYQQKEQRRSTYDDLIEEELYARELSLLIDIAVEKMPPQRRNIFIMSRKDGLSNEEIAQRLNISKRTVENHMTQALAELRKIAYSTLLLFFLKKNCTSWLCVLPHSSVSYNIRRKIGQKKHTYINREIFSRTNLSPVNTKKFHAWLLDRNFQEEKEKAMVTLWEEKSAVANESTFPGIIPTT